MESSWGAANGTEQVFVEHCMCLVFCAGVGQGVTTLAARNISFLRNCATLDARFNSYWGSLLCGLGPHIHHTTRPVHYVARGGNPVSYSHKIGYIMTYLDRETRSHGHRGSRSVIVKEGFSPVVC